MTLIRLGFDMDRLSYSDTFQIHAQRHDKSRLKRTLLSIQNLIGPDAIGMATWNSANEPQPRKR
jgi:hypothetical protein